MSVMWYLEIVTTNCPLEINEFISIQIWLELLPYHEERNKHTLLNDDISMWKVSGSYNV